LENPSNFEQWAFLVERRDIGGCQSIDRRQIPSLCS